MTYSLKWIGKNQTDNRSGFEKTVTRYIKSISCIYLWCNPMSRLEEILRRKENRKTRLRVSLDSIVRQLKKIGAIKIILFGSLVKGEIDAYSDLDLLVIMPPTRSGKEWMRFIYENVERGCASDIIAYNQKEFEENLPASIFLKHVLGSGRIIHEKTT